MPEDAIFGAAERPRLARLATARSAPRAGRRAVCELPTAALGPLWRQLPSMVTDSVVSSPKGNSEDMSW